VTLRRFTLGLGFLLLAGAFVAAIFRQVFAIHLLLLGLMLTAGVIFETWRYKRTLSTPPTGAAVATGERFVDPGSGELIEVYCDPRTGERSYVKLKSSRASCSKP
jgi:hypothetical protein